MSIWSTKMNGQVKYQKLPCNVGKLSSVLDQQQIKGRIESFFKWDDALKVQTLLLPVAILIASFALQAQETTTFEYDAQGRLIKSEKSGGPSDGTASTFSPRMTAQFFQRHSWALGIH